VSSLRLRVYVLSVKLGLVEAIGKGVRLPPVWFLSDRDVASALVIMGERTMSVVLM